MTSSRYYIARFAQSFGYFRKNQRMADAASEMHLLREAEAQLGSLIWENIENVEELSVEYWNLRKVTKANELNQQKLVKCHAQLLQAYEERVSFLNSTPEVHQELSDRRIALLTELEVLAQRRDEIIAEAREVRRTYDGLRMKLEVLKGGAPGSSLSNEQVDEIKSRLADLKSKFSGLKQKRLEIGAEIKECDAQIDLVEEQLSEKKKDHRVDASEAFQVISDSNKEISILRAESGLLDTQMRQLYAEIGRFVSRHTQLHAACAAAAASQQGLVDVMRALRRSIMLNHRLSGNA